MPNLDCCLLGYLTSGFGYGAAYLEGGDEIRLLFLACIRQVAHPCGAVMTCYPPSLIPTITGPWRTACPLSPAHQGCMTLDPVSLPCLGCP